MDLSAAARDGIDFFTHKVTESNNMRDQYFGQAMQRAVSANIKFIGGYHVVRTGPSPKDQAWYYYNYLNAMYPDWVRNPNFFVQADVEKWPYDGVSSTLGEDVADALEQQCQRKCVLYASKGQYGDSLFGTSHPLWNANYGSNSVQHYRELYNSRGGDSGPGWQSYSGLVPKIWQYGSQARIGSQNTCDANAFRGTIDDFASMLGITITPQGEEETTMFLATPDHNITSTSVIYVCDGLVSRPVSQGDAQTMLYCSESAYGKTYNLMRGDPSKNTSSSKEWGDLGSYKAAVRLAWGASYFGPVGAPVTISDADATNIANKVAEQIPGGMSDEEVKAIINQTTLKVN